MSEKVFVHPFTGREPSGAVFTHTGMSLRDHFAALAMAELVRANPDRAHHAVAIDAYRQADAMLKARELAPRSDEP